MTSFVHVVVPFVIQTFGTATPEDILAPLPRLATDLVQMAQERQVNPEVLAKDLLPIGQAVANYYVPGLGIGIAVGAMILKHSHPMTFEEEQEWMSRQGIQNQ